MYSAVEGNGTKCSYQDVLSHLNLSRSNELFSMSRPVKDHKQTTRVSLELQLFAILDVVRVSTLLVYQSAHPSINQPTLNLKTQNHIQSFQHNTQILPILPVFRGRWTRPSFPMFGWWQWVSKQTCKYPIKPPQRLAVENSAVSLQSWNNQHIRWQPNDFCGIKRVSLPTDVLWKPDLTIEEM